MSEPQPLIVTVGRQQFPLLSLRVELGYTEVSFTLGKQQFTAPAFDQELYISIPALGLTLVDTPSDCGIYRHYAIIYFRKDEE